MEGQRDERGSAVVDFVLVSLVLVPLVLGIMQVALVMFVRNTLASAASEGARFGATIDRGPGDGAARTRQQIRGAVADRFARGVTARSTKVGGVPGVVVHVHAVVPALGLWGPGISLDIDGHAVKEQAP
ncbi:MAG: TadE family protein [Marmoricola sp.]